MLDEEIIYQKINALFDKGAFDSKRIFFRKITDKQPFFSANIIAILNKCTINDARLLKNLEDSKASLQDYQRGHLAYHWPLTHGKSRMANAPLLGRLNFLSLSPDADCSCLLQIATQNIEIIEDIVAELAFYRVDNENFRLPSFQGVIPSSGHTFLTWFPARGSGRVKKLETIDIVVHANILWFLGKYGKLETPGAQATVDFIRKTLATNLIIKKTFELSPYYPFPLVILFHIARAVMWGELKDLYNSGIHIVRLANQIKAKSSLDYLLLAAIGCYFKERALIKSNLEQVFKKGIEYSPIYVSPLLFPVAQHFSPLLGLAKQPLTHIKFSSQSFQWALLLWIIQEIKKENIVL